MNGQKNYEWMVYVSCMTFNHAPYIVDAMNGFTMQDTNFPFVCTIVDDASTDGEQDVIKQYLNDNFDLEDNKVARHGETNDYVLTFARHKTNRNCYFAVLYLKYNHYCKKTKAPYIVEWRDKAKYRAMCEGDDYWIDPFKLQKQVDIMEKDMEIGLVRTDTKKYIQKKDIMIESVFSQPPFSEIKDTHDDYLINGWFLAPCTWVFRSDLADDIPMLNSKYYFAGDLNIVLSISSKSKVFYDPSITAVYRELESSASHFNSYRELFEFKQKIKNTRIYYAKSRPIEVRMKCWKKLCLQRIPPKNQLKYFPRWVYICVNAFYRLLIAKD